MGAKPSPKKKRAAPVRKPKKKTSGKKKTARKSPATRSRKPAKKAVKKPVKKSAIPAGDQIGKVVAFFRVPVVAVVKVTKGVLKTGDLVWVKGHTTDYKLTISSLQVDHRPVSQANKGQEVGLKVPARARRGDRLYRISS